MSVLIVKITQTIKMKNLSPKQCAEEAWRLSETRLKDVDIVLAVANAEIRGVYALDGYHRITRGNNKGRTRLALRKHPDADSLKLKYSSESYYEAIHSQRRSILYI